MFDTLRRENNKFGIGIDVVWGIKAGGPAIVQSIRFDRKLFTPAEARSWLEAHEYKPLAFEPAIDHSLGGNAAEEPEAPSSLGLTNAFGELQVLASATRREQFQGREHVVAPVVMLVEGVHRGLYYPADEIGQTSDLWNGMPITVNHPMRDGKPISASDPKVLEESAVGWVFNTKWDGKLRSEAWIDVARAEALAPEILRALSDGSGANLEVSTGLFTDEDKVAGQWNGEDYRATVRSYRPNHLALLPNGQGACNWGDGCGIRLNKEAERVEMEIDDGPGEGQEPPVQVTGASGSSGSADPKEETKTMDRNEAITKLIECECSRFVTNDRPFLETLTDEQLAAAQALDPAQAPESSPPNPPAMPPATEETQPPPTPKIEFKAPAAPVILTAEQYVAAAPPAVAGVLRRALAREQAEKNALVGALVGNERNRFPEEALRDKDIEELKALTDLAAITVNYAPQAGGPLPRPKTGPPPMPPVFEIAK